MGVLRDQAAVKDQRDAKRCCHGFDLAQVLHRKRLPADQVGGRFHAHIGDMLHPDLLHSRCEFLQVQVALEGVAAFGLQGFVAKKFQHPAACQVNMRLGGGEVVVHQHHITRFDEYLCQQVLGSSSLVHRHDMRKSQHLLHSVLQAVEALAAGVGIVGDHHRPQLLVAHGVGAAVGQHVQENIFGA